MLKYLVIQLCDSAPSFCHYSNNKKDAKLIPLSTLKDALSFAMLENLMVQIVYPDKMLTNEYKALINTIDHTDIVSSHCTDDELLSAADVVVFNNISDAIDYSLRSTHTIVVRSTFAYLLSNSEAIKKILRKVKRLNIVITDVEKFIVENAQAYVEYLDDIASVILEEYIKEHEVQLNILTDRMMLDNMNNCNAGVESLTLAPNGKLYVCPAFYFDDSNDVCILDSEIALKNQQLYRIEYAPICHSCDALHCKRCVWLNRNLTLEVNTPSKQQCIIAHIERNASRKLLEKIRKVGEFLPDKNIPEIDYLDPFDKIINNK